MFWSSCADLTLTEQPAFSIAECFHVTISFTNRYTQIMRSLLVILVAWGVMLMPLQASAIRIGCDCTTQTTANESIGDGLAGAEEHADACCSPVPQRPGQEPAPSPLPCDESECPSSCCTTVLQSSFVLPLAPGIHAPFKLVRVTHPSAVQIASQPHLLRLKRPPRSV